MKEYENRIQEAFDWITEEHPPLINMAKESDEGRRVLLNILHRESNVDKVVIMKYINANTELKYKIGK